MARKVRRLYKVDNRYVETNRQHAASPNEASLMRLLGASSPDALNRLLSQPSSQWPQKEFQALQQSGPPPIQQDEQEANEDALTLSHALRHPERAEAILASRQSRASIRGSDLDEYPRAQQKLGLFQPPPQ